LYAQLAVWKQAPWLRDHRRYGKDRTFSIPSSRCWRWLANWRLAPRHAASFELAAFPQRWYAALRLPVVSYALRVDCHRTIAPSPRPTAIL